MSSSLNKPHRKIWHEHFGNIPVDENGITYEIHHLNGDHKDNRIENLSCVSISEHYDIHFEQKDSYACAAILKRLRNNCGVFESKQKQLDMTGKNNPRYGRKHSAESRLKISNNHADVSGENNPMHGVSHTKESKEKMSKARLGKCKGVPKPSETRKKMSDAAIRTEILYEGNIYRGWKNLQEETGISRHMLLKYKLGEVLN